MNAPLPFPEIELDHLKEDANPGIQLFGRRFHRDQSALELLIELLLVVNSEKDIEHRKEGLEAELPDMDTLRNWPKGGALSYSAPVRLDLKLFSFLGASQLETRHESHKERYRYVIKSLEEVIVTEGVDSKREILLTLENLLLGFQGAGINRNWCAQNFIPIARKFLAPETQWRPSVAKNYQDLNWDYLMAHFNTFFRASSRSFLARGGELLYLQLCNALRQEEDVIREFLTPFSFRAEEANPVHLHASLRRGLASVTNRGPDGLDAIAGLIEGISEESVSKPQLMMKRAECAWCPQDSWREGYLFAIELDRLTKAALDPIELIDLLTVACSMQVLRSLCAQAARYGEFREERDIPSSLGYTWIFAQTDGNSNNVKLLSQRNLQIVQRLIYQAIRQPVFTKNALKKKSVKIESLNNDADKDYGHKLFLKKAKEIGLVVPKKGPGARFVLNEKVLRFLVLSLLRPDERITYEYFKELLFLHYGIAVDGEQLRKAAVWSDLPYLESAGAEGGEWLARMLEASGFLVHLSDACSLVHNPFPKAASVSEDLADGGD